MTISKSKIRALGVAGLALPLFLGTASPALAATPPAGAYAEAYGLHVDTTVLSGSLPAKIGPEAHAASSCPGTGGTKTAQVLGVGDPAAAKAEVITDTATTDCGAKSATAMSRIVNVDALGAAAQVKIHADAITATSTTSCAKAPKGSTQIVNLSIGGNAVPVPTDVAPNTEIPGLSTVLDALGLRIIFNEQHPASEGRGLVVNAIHIIASGTGQVPIGGSVIRGDIIIGHAVSGVVCPGGPGTDNGGLPKPDISFTKDASTSAADPGETFTYTATVKNTSAKSCEVLRFIDHIAPAFTLVSTSGTFGTKYDTPPPARTDGGVDAVLRPTGVTIGAGKSATQKFVVTVKDDAAPGTYYNSLEIFCGANGDFVSGPLAPVSVPRPAAPVAPVEGPVAQPPAGPTFAATGLSAPLAGTALLLLVAAAGTRRLQLSRR